MDFNNIYQTGNPQSGGWRYPYSGRPTSVDALYKPMGIDPEFLKKVAGSREEPKGLLDQSLQAQPLTGLLETGGGGDANGETQGTTSGTTGIGLGTMSDARNSAAMQAGLMGLAKGGFGLLGVGKGLLDANNVMDTTNASVLGHANSLSDPIAALNAMQGWTDIDQGYMNSVLSGAPLGIGDLGGDGGFGIGGLGLGGAGGLSGGIGGLGLGIGIGGLDGLGGFGIGADGFGDGSVGGDGFGDGGFGGDGLY